MFQLTASSTTSSASRAKFASFADAANCAVVHIRQRGGDVQIRYAGNGTLIADLRLIDGLVSVAGICEGKGMVDQWEA